MTEEMLSVSFSPCCEIICIETGEMCCWSFTSHMRLFTSANAAWVTAIQGQSELKWFLLIGIAGCYSTEQHLFVAGLQYRPLLTRSLWFLLKGCATQDTARRSVMALVAYWLAHLAVLLETC